MEIFLNIWYMIIFILKDSFTSPLFITIYILLLILIGWQYYRVEQVSARIFNLRYNIYLKSTAVSAFLGLIGGLCGSFLLIIIGIDLTTIGIFQLWLIAVVLMLINPRYLCFAYAGGILAIISLITGYPRISIPQLMGLIAVLHLVESILIMLNGHFNPIPVYVKKQNTIRGGFNLQKFWPLPLIALVSAGVSDPTAGVIMPEWWPLLSDYSGFIEGRTFTLLPVLAVLGYGEITTTSIPQARVKKSAFNLFIFSLTLLVLAILASNGDIFLIIAALFSPLGHEFIIWLGMKEEAEQDPVYVTTAAGVMVLDVLPGSPAARGGLKSQDIILSVNGELISSLPNLEKLAALNRRTYYIEVKRKDKLLILNLLPSPGEEWGIIPVPENNRLNHLSVMEETILQKVGLLVQVLWQKIGKK